MSLLSRAKLLLLSALPVACGVDPGATASGTGGASLSPTTVGSTGPGSTSSGSGDDTSGSATGDASDTAAPTTSGGVKYDVGLGSGGPDTEGPPPSCKVVEDDAVGSCRDRAPAASFTPDIQWEWWGPDGEERCSIIPLVANLTDDNGDGAIDLCDIPDVVVVTAPLGITSLGHISVLDGKTGAVHFTSPELVRSSITPALGDIDGDGLVDIVTLDDEGLIVLEHHGGLKWKAATPENSNFLAVALADLESDGDVEIVVGNFVADHTGKVLWSAPDYFWEPADPIYLSATAVADLDGDGDQEVVMGRSAYHHDGTQYYKRPEIGPGYPQIADLDGDGLPEVLITNMSGLTVLEHDGQIKYQDLRPNGVEAGQWFRPATVHDFDGDGAPEYATGSATQYSVYEGDATLVWTAPVDESSCCAAGTAFDFLGDGVAEAMYADELNLYIFDGAGAPLLSAPRSSWTNIEYPVVVDVDNDGSAEILVVSNTFDVMRQTAPTLQVIRDKEDRWIQARRIWNQHTYHVTNVREDGTIPQFEKPSWKHLNTYRTNAQIEGGGICKPIPLN
jgi:hypothetical protein